MRGARIIRWSIRWVMVVSSRMAYEPRFHVKEEKAKGEEDRTALSFECIGQHLLLGKLPDRYGRQPAGQPRDAHAAVAKQAGDVKGSTISFEIRIGRQDHFLYTSLLHPSQECIHRELFRPHVFQRGQAPLQYVIKAAVSARAFHRSQVARLFNDTENPGVAARVRADTAQLAFRQVETLPAGMHALGDAA